MRRKWQPLLAAIELDRNAYGFEIKKDFHAGAKELIDTALTIKKDVEELGYSPTEIKKQGSILFE